MARLGEEERRKAVAKNAPQSAIDSAIVGLLDTMVHLVVVS